MSARELSIHVVFDTATRTLHIEDPGSMPVDSRAWVWDRDAEEWRRPSDQDIDDLMDAEVALAKVIDNLVVPT